MKQKKCKVESKMPITFSQIRRPFAPAEQVLLPVLCVLWFGAPTNSFSIEKLSPHHVLTTRCNVGDMQESNQRLVSPAAPLLLASSTLALLVTFANPLPSVATSSAPDTIISRLSETDAFKNLRQELPMTRAVKELNDLKDLQDSRLDACADRGIYWEQCFMFGENDGGTGSRGIGSRAQKRGSNPNNGMDYQLISPNGSLEPGSSSGLTSGMARGQKTKIPTW